MFKVTNSSLLTSLQCVTGIVDRKQSMPILSNLLFSFDEQNLFITVSDSETELTTSIRLDGEINQTESLTIPARKLFDICRSLDSDILLTFDSDSSFVHLKANHSKFKFVTLPAEEYPRMDKTEHEQHIKINEEDLKNLIEKTKFSMANNDPRLCLNGLLFEIKEGKLCVVATDGHRLAFKEILVNCEDNDVKNQFILPSKTVSELYRLLSYNRDKEVDIYFDQRYMRFEMGGISLNARLIDASFPDYKKVIPDICENPVLADCKALSEKLSRVAILSDEKLRKVDLKLSKNALDISAYNSLQEGAEEQLDVQYQGEEINISFNVRYLIEALTTIDTDDVCFSIRSSSHGCLITDVHKKLSCCSVVMPLRD